MKRFFALLVMVSLFVFAGNAFAATPSTGGHVIQLDPTPENPAPGGDTPSTPTPSTGSDQAKTVEAPQATTTETKTVTVTTTTTQTVTVSSYSNAAVAAQQVVKTVTKTETTQSVTAATDKNKVTTITTTQIEQVTTAVTTVIAQAANTTTESGAAVVNTDTGEVNDTKAFADAVLNAVKTNTNQTTDENDESAVSAAASTSAIASSLIKGNTGATGTDPATATGNMSNITDKAQEKEDGTMETFAETLVRLINETIEKAAEVLTSETTTTTVTTIFQSTVTETSTPVNIEVIQAGDEANGLESTNTTKTVTNADGTKEEVTNDEAPSFEDVMSMLSQQTVEEVATASTSGNSQEQAKAETKQREIQSEVPVAVVPPVTPKREGIFMINMPTMKPDTYKKPINLRTLRNDRRGGRGRSAAFSGAALDANEDGSGTFLNSLGNVITNVPGEDEWQAPADDPNGEEMLVIPGYVTVAMYMVPDVDYTPVITTTSEAISDVVQTAAADEEVTVTQTNEVQIADVPVYVATDGAYSTSFDATLEAHFDAESIDHAVARFIPEGEEGVWNLADVPENEGALRTLSIAVVRTLPVINVTGDNASDTARYVMQVRFDIPRNSDAHEVKGTDLLAFYPRGLLTRNEAGAYVTVDPGEAEFLDKTGRAPLTDAMIEEIAAGTHPDAVELPDGETMGYTGYIVMTLDKLADGEAPYTPVITVRVTDIRPETGAFSVTADRRNVSVVLGETETVTLTPNNASGDISYASDADWVTVASNTVTIAPTDEALVSETPHVVRITATDSGRETGSNTFTVPLNITVTRRSSGGGVGSSGGGCSAGWSILALAVLGGLISRKK